MLTPDAVLQALRTVKYPGYSRDIVSFGLVKEVLPGPDSLRVQLQLTSANHQVAEQLRQECERVLRDLPGAGQVSVEVRQPQAPGGPGGAGPGAGGPNPWANQNRIPGVGRVVAVASGKGGVGKSTVSVNLACALQQLGAQVGLLDCDIYGPSIPLMMGVRERPTVNAQEQLVPPTNHGVRLMSIGFLVEGDQPVIWRGPMITKTIQQFLFSVAWGELDYLLVDLPPGTGDAQLSLCQTVPLDGGVIVTTPQAASVDVVRKGIAMFTKVNVPILGIIENMSYFTTLTGERVEIFGHGGGRAEAERQRTAFLGEVPIYTAIREGGDAGIPVVVSAPKSAPGQAFLAIAENLRQLPG
ncbi:MAG: Mrp/NBP35 family ATP-binding protein [Verrucomicrobia bacterium]|nr:Mrp/NBP35 family ATP-binding protein [Verrucomicrobiota bacterium]